MKNIFFNGKVYLGKDERASAFVVEDGKFTFVGSDKDAMRFAETTDNVVDLKGKFVTPGFNDSHMHLVSLGNSLNMVELYDAASIDDVIQKGKDFMKTRTFEKDQFVMGYGWNNDYFAEKRFINRYDLDKISTEYPVCFIRVCYHVYVVNSKALEVLGIDENTKQVSGGVFDIDENGKPLGIFRENACELVFNNITPLPFNDIKKCITDGAEFCNSMGLTSVATDDLSEFGPVPYNVIIKAYQDLEKEGKLNVRVNQQSRFHNYEEFQQFLRAGYTTGVGTDMFRIGPLKIITDGALGGRTAYMREPYADDPTTKGVLSMSQEVLDKWVKCGHDHNMQIAIHAIGDAAMDTVLNSYEKVVGGDKNNDRRHGIVHAQLTDPKNLQRMRDMRIITYVQTSALEYDITMAEARLGKERVKDTYKYATMTRTGIPTSNGSDAPVEWPDVMAGMQIAIIRRSIKNNTDVFFPEEAMTLDEAVDSFTKAGAYSTFEENKKGQIKAGMLADFVVFDKDIFDVPFDHLAETQPVETWLGGNLIWKKEK